MTRTVSRLAVGAAWCGAVALIGVSVVWGRAYQRDSPEIFLGAAPLVGRSFVDGWDWRFGWGLIAAAVVAAMVVGSVVRGWWWRARLRWVVAASSVGSGVFAVLLALTDGRDGVLHGAVHPSEYLATLSIAPPAAEFVRTFVERIDEYSVHVRGHPPGFVLVLKAMDVIGLGGEWPTALLSVVATIAVTSGVLLTVWATADAGWVRGVAPLLIVAPYMLWMVTSADAVYAAVGAWGTAACALGLRATGWRAVVAGGVAGLLLSSLLFLTYGGVTFVLLPLTLVVSARRAGGTARTVVAAIAVAVAIVAAFFVAGFWWFAGAAETRLQYWAGSAHFRTWTYFGIANIAVALIALGPATFAGLLRLRDRQVWVVVGGGLLAVAASHLSQYSRAEVERLWLLFFPWIAVAGGALLVSASTRARAAMWVGAQAAGTIALQAALVSKW
ncbi:MAG: hypothetical protein ACRDZZ_01315 [Ilumatobacteraceae bacterium]